MIALYNDPEATELFEDLGEVKKGDSKPFKKYLCYRGAGFARNITVESGSPDIQVIGAIPGRMNDGDIVELTIEWNPGEPPTGSGILIKAEEVQEITYGD